MIEYLYFVKWLDDNGTAEEVFEFFDEAKSFAMGLLSQQPEIHQTEVIRNDFGECVDSNEIGKVWSWEELMDDIPENTETDGDFHIFTRGDFAKYADGYDPENDPEFDDRDITFETDCVLTEDSKSPGYYGEEIFSMLDKMSGDHINKFLSEYRWFEPLGIDSLTDTSDKYDAINCYLDSDSGYRLYSNLDNYCYYNGLHESLSIPEETDCVACEHPLDEEYYGSPRELASYVEDVISHLFFDLGKNFIDYEDFSGEVLDVLERLYGDELGLAEYHNDSKRYNNWCDAVFCEVSRQLTSNPEFAEVKSMYINESCRKPIPEGKSIKDLVEEMEENEDTVECKWCEELFDKSECRYEINMGWLCPYCIEALKSRGEELTFREGYEDLEEAISLTEAPADYIYTHLVGNPDAKMLVLEEITNDPEIVTIINNNNAVLNIRDKQASSGYTRVGKVVDFVFSNNRIEVAVRGINQITYEYDKTNFIDLEVLLTQGYSQGLGFAQKAIAKNCAGYKLLVAIRNAAVKLNTENNPRNPRAVAARDRNIDVYLTNNPDIANEFKKHITKIHYEIPKFEDELELESLVDQDGVNIKDNKKALRNLININNNFFNSDYFGEYGIAADEAGMVTDRLPNVASDTHYGVAVWGAVGKISFDTNLRNLPELFAAIRISRGEPADSTTTFEGRTIDCVRLAKALTKYFDNIKFYEEAVAEPPKSNTEATPLVASLSRTDNNRPKLKEHLKHKRNKRI